MANKEVDEIIKKHLINRLCEGYDTFGDDKTYLAKYYKNYAQRIEDFEIFDSDIIVTSFPKSGTTWTQEMVWLICNDLDYEGAKVNLNKRFPFFEFSMVFDVEVMKKEGLTSEELSDTIEYVRQLKSPRFIKTHLPFSLLPKQIKNNTKKPKIVYVIRNPKDACTSFYYHKKILPLGTTATLEEYAKAFLADKLLYTPYWKHVLGFWEQRNDNLLILRYEDMKKDLPSVIGKVAKFFQKELTTEQVEELSKHLSFDSMKNNNAVNYSVDRDTKWNKLVTHKGSFMRSGTVGQYKQELSEETIKKFDEWIKENIKGTTFEQEYDFKL